MPGAALAAGAVAHRDDATGKHKKNKKKCHAPNTKCGKKRCCQPNHVCVGGRCETPGTTTQTPFATVRCNAGINANVSGFRRFAQPFVASGDGKIASASFTLVGIAADTPLGVQIRTTQNGVPAQQVLGTAILMDIEPFSPPEDPQEIMATFHPAVAVTRGQTYALVITNLVDNDVQLAGSAPGACPLVCYVDADDTNTFEPYSANVSLLFSVSP